MSLEIYRYRNMSLSKDIVTLIIIRKKKKIQKMDEG